jgi:hypothetical protein
VNRRSSAAGFGDEASRPRAGARKIFSEFCFHGLPSRVFTGIFSKTRIN